MIFSYLQSFDQFSILKNRPKISFWTMSTIKIHFIFINVGFVVISSKWLNVVEMYMYSDWKDSKSPEDYTIMKLLIAISVLKSF